MWTCSLVSLHYACLIKQTCGSIQPQHSSLSPVFTQSNQNTTTMWLMIHQFLELVPYGSSLSSLTSSLWNTRNIIMSGRNRVEKTGSNFQDSLSVKYMHIMLILFNMLAVINIKEMQDYIQLLYSCCLIRPNHAVVWVRMISLFIALQVFFNEERERLFKESLLLNG